jgi:hypothetical protein
MINKGYDKLVESVETFSLTVYNKIASVVGDLVTLYFLGYCCGVEEVIYCDV